MKGMTIQELAALTSSEIEGDPLHVITGVDELESASSCEASFLDNPRYEEKMKHSMAGVIFIHPSVKRHEGKNYLISHQPSLSFQKAIYTFLPKISSGFTGIHPTAVVHEEAILGENVVIGPQAVIDRKARIGSHTTIGAFAFIGAESVVGSHCTIHPHVTIRENCELGNRVILQPGAVIGSCGFGYYTDAQGKHHALDQLGKVVIEDDVEIGANTTIDRARFKTTLIKQGTKIDNLVQIAHQVMVGKDCLIVSQVGIAGSTKILDHCILGGQVGVGGHLTIGPQVIFAARSAASKSVTTPGIYAGAPVAPIKEHHETFVLQKNIKNFVKRIKKIEDQLSQR